MKRLPLYIGAAVVVFTCGYLFGSVGRAVPVPSLSGPAVVVDYPESDSTFRRSKTKIDVHKVTSPNGETRELGEAGSGREWVVTIDGTVYRGTAMESRQP